MPAYSFQERFVPMILDDSKRQTIRTRRKNPAKVGDTLYLYYGMRTKWCKKLKEVKCKDTYSIVIFTNYILLFQRLIEEDEIADIIEKKKVITSDRVYLINKERDLNEFAWADGFRSEGATSYNPKGSWELMKRFWKQTHQLPWVGDLIQW